MNAGVRTPPSQSESLPPRNGALLPPAPHPETGDPLSEANMKRLVSHNPSLMSAELTFATVSSIAEIIPDHLFRSGESWRYKLSKRAGVW